MTWLALLMAAAMAAVPAQRVPPPTLAIDRIVSGGQAEIDAGYVVQVIPCAPLQGCPVWLAGHRSTHGSVFAQVATLVPGDTVSVLGVRYTVQSNRIVCCSGQPFTATADLTLQTSATEGRVYIVEASVT